MIKSWIVVKTKTNQEKIASLNLENQNFELFFPKFKTIIKQHNKFKEIIKPVFPNYLFIYIDLEEGNWRKINNTRGVSKLVVFGNEIPIIQCHIIEELKNRFSLNKVPSRNKQLNIGDNVEILTGPFSKLFGKINHIETDTRICLLLDLLGTQRRVSVNSWNLISKQV